MNNHHFLSALLAIFLFQSGMSREDNFSPNLDWPLISETIIADCVDIDTTICSDEVFIFENQEYSEEGIYTLTSSTCEGSFLLNLTVTPKPDDFITNATVCEIQGCFWSDTTYYQSGTYFLEGENCTANHILNLTVLPYQDEITYQEICSGESFTWFVNGQIYAVPGIYTVYGDCKEYILYLSFYESCHGTQGKAVFDYDNNGCDDLDPLIGNLNVTNEDFTKKTNINGSYVLPSFSNTASISAFHDDPIYSATPIDTIITFESLDTYVSVDYCVTTEAIINDLAISIVPIGFTRPGIPSDFRIYCSNKGTTALSGVATLQIDTSVFSAAVPDTLSSIGNLYTWEIETILPGEQSTIDLTLIPDFQLVFGDILSLEANISHDEEDATPPDNSFILAETVRTSFDPNDKTLLEGASLHPSSIGEYVHYMIRFENIGTAPAYYVRLTDTLDTDVFDVRSFQMVDSSHPCEVEIEDENILRVLYEAIELPYLEEDGNKGFFTFRIRTKEDLKEGDLLSNQAKIVFDFNPPILTNISEAIFEYPETVATDVIHLDYLSISTFPNPVKDYINLSIQGATSNNSVVDIINEVGESVLSSLVTDQVSRIDCSTFSAGIYMIKVSNGNMSTTQRMLITK